VHGKVAAAKLFASEAAGRIVDRSLQILGGRGYMTENPVARLWREVRVDRIWEGTSEIQRLILARGLLKRGVEPYVD
jgi:alkylation response protein AidB-like acyl-CoA dehydrogenase